LGLDWSTFCSLGMMDTGPRWSTFEGVNAEAPHLMDYHATTAFTLTAEALVRRKDTENSRALSARWHRLDGDQHE